MVYCVIIGLSDQPRKPRTNVQWMNSHQDERLDRKGQGHLNAALQTKSNFTAKLSPTLQDDSSQLVAKLQRFKQHKYLIIHFS